MDYSNVITERIDSIYDELKDMKTFIFEHPEIALEERESSRYMCDYFARNGFEVERGIAGLETAFIAKKKNGSGRRVCLMAEYDALPGAGHACGHHLIGTACAGAAMGLAAALDAGLEGEVVVIGSPAEETGDGKPVLVDAGFYDGFDAAMSLHPSNANIFKPEWIAIGGIDFSFRGKASHAGSNPDLGVNALDALYLFYGGFSVLRQQLRDGSRIHGIIMNGGTAANIIPDFGSIRLEFRSPDPDYFNEIVQKVIRCAEGAALATGCELEYHHYEPTCHGVKHNETLLAEYASQMAEVGLYDDGTKIIGSTDVGNVSRVAPTIHPLFKIMDLDYNIHTPQFKDCAATDEAFDRMLVGSKVMAKTLLRVLEDDVLAAAIKAEAESGR